MFKSCPGAPDRIRCSNTKTSFLECCRLPSKCNSREVITAGAVLDLPPQHDAQAEAHLRLNLSLKLVMFVYIFTTHSPNMTAMENNQRFGR